MLSIDEFKELIRNPESSILDFKAEMYDLTDKDGIAGFVKDIICFTNTIRSRVSYILIGILEKKDKTLELLGLAKSYDDAIFQSQIKDKVFPRPSFLFYTLDHEGKKFGIFEFQITKYSQAPVPIVKMKGLEIGHVYYRNGTTNVEALGNEIGNLYQWFESLSHTSTGPNLNEEIGSYIKRLSQGQEKVSVIISELFPIAKKNSLGPLLTFCLNELQGFKDVDPDQEQFSYRIARVKISYEDFEVNPLASGYHANDLEKEFDRNESVKNIKMFIPDSIRTIEDRVATISSNTLCFKTQISSKVLSMDKEFPVYVYIFKDDYLRLYQNVVQKAIDIVVKIG